jgi:hypothetical protein
MACQQLRWCVSSAQKANRSVSSVQDGEPPPTSGDRRRKFLLNANAPPMEPKSGSEVVPISVQNILLVGIPSPEKWA